jgi:acetate kinase
MRILTINNGSSSLKAALYEMDGDAPVRRILSLDVARIGVPGSQLRIRDDCNHTVLDQARDVPDNDAALQTLFDWLEQDSACGHPDAVGHRIVHGGAQYSEPQLVTPELVAALQKLVPLAPNHLPPAIDGIQAASRLYPHLPQVACFDTAFHRHMPVVAQMYALPRELYAGGVMRYGFHGLSYQYLLQTLQELDAAAAKGRLIMAHLGNGASMVAIRDGASIDTSMGMTPVPGLVMGTRPGDVDPGALVYIMQQNGLSAADLETLLNKRSGLLGLSGSSEDMKDLLDIEASDTRAAEAIAIFCYQARKYIGAYAAALGGLDTLVFAGGIGEKGAPVRERICAGLEFLGIDLDAERNRANAPIVSRDGSRVTVRVIKTDEDLMIARATFALTRV